MREFDEYGLKMCQYQGRVFEESVEKTKCSTPVFLRRFMLSNVAKRMDKIGFYYTPETESDVIEDVEMEYSDSDYGKNKYDKEELYWMGYIYRYWCYTNDVSSKSVYKIVKPEELRKLYNAYHTLDPQKAINNIKEAKGIEDEDMIAKGVRIMREVRSKFA